MVELRSRVKDDPFTPHPDVLVALSTVCQMVHAGGPTQVRAAQGIIQTAKVRVWLDEMKRLATKRQKNGTTHTPRIQSQKTSLRGGTRR